MQGGRRQPLIFDLKATPNSTRRGKVSGGGNAKTLDHDCAQGVESGARIRRLTPTECERLQGFPDGWTSKGVSSIMEICVKINNVIASQLLKDSALCTISDGKDMEFQIYQLENKGNANIAVEMPLLVSSAIGTINLGSDTVMLFNRKEMWNTDELTKKSVTLEQMENPTTTKLWKIVLEENLPKEKLSTILTSIREIMTSPTSIFARTDENIIGCTIRLNSQELNSLKEESFGLRMVNTHPVSDTQRYKTLGNAVTVNVIEAIVNRILSR
jgi:hypothetical protein